MKLTEQIKQVTEQTFLQVLCEKKYNKKLGLKVSIGTTKKYLIVHKGIYPSYKLMEKSLVNAGYEMKIVDDTIQWIKI